MEPLAGPLKFPDFVLAQFSALLFCRGADAPVFAGQTAPLFYNPGCPFGFRFNVGGRRVEAVHTEYQASVHFFEPAINFAKPEVQGIPVFLWNFRIKKTRSSGKQLLDFPGHVDLAPDLFSLGGFDSRCDRGFCRGMLHAKPCENFLKPSFDDAMHLLNEAFPF